MDFNFKKSRSQKVKKDGSRNSKVKNKEPLRQQNSPQTVKSNVSMGNVKQQNNTVDEHQPDVEKKALQDIPNLKRETDEIRQLTQKPPKSLRFITSNWNRCDDLPEGEDLQDEDAFLDFTHLLQASGGHFKFKSERDWDANMSDLCNKPKLRPNIGGLLACIPLYTKLNMAVSVFSNDELTEIHDHSKNNIPIILNMIKNENTYILQEDNLKVCGNDVSKSNDILYSISSSSDVEAAGSEPDLESTYMQVISASNNSENIISEENLENVTELCMDKGLEEGKTGAKVDGDINISNSSQRTSSLVDEIETASFLLHECALNESINTEICQNVHGQKLVVDNSNTLKARNGSTSEDKKDYSDEELDFLLTLKKPMPVTNTAGFNQLVSPTIDKDISVADIVQFSTVTEKSTANLDDWLEAFCKEEDDS